MSPLALAATNSRSILICGCGEQGAAQLAALREVLPLALGFAWDRDHRKADVFAKQVTDAGFAVAAVTDLAAAARASDIIVTCTPARSPVLRVGDVREGTFIAAVGADNEDKSEIEPSLLASSKVVVDVMEQCATIGDLHHALDAGAMRREDVHAELGDIVSGRRPGRETAAEVIIFDSTGTALEDVAAASLVYERAVAAGTGVEISLAS